MDPQTSGITITEEEPELPKEIPSLKKTVLKPRNLAIALVVSIVINFLLLFAAIFASSSDNPTTTVLPTTKPSNTPIVTLRPSPGPSISPDEKLSNLAECFENCSTEELIQKTLEEAVKVTDFKSHSLFKLISKKNCYNDYLISSGLNEQHSYSKYSCASGYLTNPPENNIHIENNLYILNSSGNWNIESKTRISETKLVDVLNQLNDQPEKTATKFEPGNKYRTISTTGQTINDVNQLVNKTVTVSVNRYLEVVDYKIDIETVSLESGYFFGLNETNDVKAPVSTGD